MKLYILSNVLLILTLLGVVVFYENQIKVINSKANNYVEQAVKSQAEQNCLYGALYLVESGAVVTNAQANGVFARCAGLSK